VKRNPPKAEVRGSNPLGRASILPSLDNWSTKGLCLPDCYHPVGSIMRVSVGILKNEHGVFYVRRKVPKRLQEAAAVVMGASKPRQTWLKQSLNAKDKQQAKRRAPPC
jgi:Domain of unknown function (DUF6538)